MPKTLLIKVYIAYFITKASILTIFIATITSTITSLQFLSKVKVHHVRY